MLVVLILLSLNFGGYRRIGFRFGNSFPFLQNGDFLSIDYLTHDSAGNFAGGHYRFLKGNNYDYRNRKILQRRQGLWLHSA